MIGLSILSFIHACECFASLSLFKTPVCLWVQLLNFKYIMSQDFPAKILSSYTKLLIICTGDFFHFAENTFYYIKVCIFCKVLFWALKNISPRKLHHYLLRWSGNICGFALSTVDEKVELTSQYVRKCWRDGVTSFKSGSLPHWVALGELRTTSQMESHLR